MPLPIENLNVAPYYDTTEQELARGYSKYLAVEGQVLQNRELNVAQGLIQGNIRKITDLIIDDASIVSGCNFTNNTDAGICTLEAGEVYFNGLLIKVPRTEWPYSQVPVDPSYVCLEIKQNVYTEADDPSLYDPAENIENTGNRGGHRLKYEAYPLIKTVSEFEKDGINNKNIIAIIKLLNRNTLGPIKPRPIFGKIYDQMAERAYDASGDFIARGLEVSATTSDYPSLKYNVKITKGRAYVKGYDYTYDKDTYILQDLALATDNNLFVPETKTFIPNTLSYMLNHRYVHSIQTVTAFTKIQDVPMTSSQNNVLIRLGELYGIAIDNITINSIIVNGYVIGTDYEIIGGNTTINWLIPTPSSYTVNVDYTIKLTESSDYSLTKDSSGTLINFLPASANIRNDIQTFSVAYTWYLSRSDLVYMSEDGMLLVKNGIPDEIDLIKQPTVPLGSLPLAYILVEPGKSPTEFSVSSFNIYRVPVVQLNSMKKKMADFEYNFAMSELETATQNKHLEQDDLYKLKNIFADAIVDYNNIDLTDHSFDATVDLFRSQITLPMIIDQIGYDQIKLRNSTGEVINNPYMELDKNDSVITDYQPYITHSIDVMPYYYKGLIPKIVCDPKVLTHVDDTWTTKVIWLPNRIIYSTITTTKWQTVTRRTTGRSRVETTTNIKSRSTVSEIVGTEVVLTKQNAVELIPNPYIHPGSVLRIAGKDFPSNTEIRLYLDNKIITPEFTDPIFTDLDDVDITNFNFKYNGIIWRPNVWQWELSNWNNGKYWKFSPPKYKNSTKSFALYYDNINKQWFYQKNGFGNDTSELLSSIPSWLKWIRRTPWINDYISSLSEEKKQIIKYANEREPITEVEYPSTFEGTGIAIITDGDGAFNVEIKIPKNTPVGTHTITAETVLPKDLNPDKYFSAQDEFVGESYTRNWVTEVYMRKIERVTETIYVEVTETRYIHVSSDPVAQSFVFDEDQFIDGIDLYFSTKSLDPDAKVWINVREMVNGFPTGKILYYKELAFDDINTPTVGSPFPATHINFDYPIYCEAKKYYAFTVGCNRDGYRIYYAKMGNRDLITNTPVIYQPHPSGVMFTSSNNETWTPIQDSDITYSLYRADYDINNKKIYYIYYVNEKAPNNSATFGSMNISIGDAILEGTDITYEYCVTSIAPDVFDPTTVSWKKLSIEEMYVLNLSGDMKLYIRAILSSTNSKLTPMANAKTFEAFIGKYKPAGSYIMIPLNIE